MELHIKVIGALFIILALIHVGFPRYFNWKKELAALGTMNRQMMKVHSFFIAFIVLLMGLLCLSSASDLINTSFGRLVSMGLAVFWTVRLVIQIFGYSPKLWKGKVFETSMHLLFTVLWVYVSAIFWLVFCGEGL